MLIFYCTWIVNHAFNILFNIISLGSIKNVIPLKMQGFPLSKFWSKDNVYSKKENSSDLVLWNKWRFQKRICLDLHMMMAPFIKKQSTVLRKIYTKVLGLSVKMCAFQCMYSFFFFLVVIWIIRPFEWLRAHLNSVECHIWLKQL